MARVANIVPSDSLGAFVGVNLPPGGMLERGKEQGSFNKRKIKHVFNIIALLRQDA